MREELGRFECLIFNLLGLLRYARNDVAGDDRERIKDVDYKRK